MLHPVVVTGGIAISLLALKALLGDNYIQKLRYEGLQNEADTLEFISKTIVPLVIIGAIAYVIITFPFNLFFL